MEVVRVLDDRKLDVLRAIVEDYVATHEPVGSKALVERHHLGVSPGDDPQRHGRAGGGGLHRPAAHQRRPGADRQGLPAVRRPAVGGQAAVSRPSGAPSSTFLDGAVDLDDVVAADGPAARPADPAGRRRAVPDR